MSTPFHSLGPFVYCPLCARPLEVTATGDLPRRHCAACDRIYYHNPAPAAGGIILDADRVLLVRRRFEPRAGEWTLPAGFLEYYESPEACALREIAEETGLSTAVQELFGVYAGDDDPRQTAVLILYRMRVTGGLLRPGDDALEVAYFAAGEVPEAVAFRAHRQALRDLFGQRLRAGWAQPRRDDTRIR